jgi:hypothetical protein
MPDNTEGKSPNQPRPPDERRANVDDFTAHLDLVDLSLGGAPSDGTGHAGSHTRLRRYLTIMLYSFIPILFVVFIIALMMTRSGDDPPAESAPAAATSEPGGQAGQAQPTTKPTNPAESTTTDDCILPASAVTITIVNLVSDVGVNDPSMFQKTWTTDFQNRTDKSVVLAVHTSEQQGDLTVVDAWDTQTLLAGGLGVQERGFLTNNIGGAAGALSWRYIDRMIPLDDRQVCFIMFKDPAVQAKAIPVDVPPAN